jgi:hypothetical protein
VAGLAGGVGGCSVGRVVGGMGQWAFSTGVGVLLAVGGLFVGVGVGCGGWVGWFRGLESVVLAISIGVVCLEGDAVRLGARAVGVWLCLLAGGLLVGVAPAAAVRGHVFSGSFGTPCLVEPCQEGKLKEPVAIAIAEREEHDAYVVDRAGNSVQIFGAGGGFVGEINGSGLLPGEEGKIAGTGGRTGEKETGRFSGPEGVAVDNACHFHEVALHSGHALTNVQCEEFDPSSGDVYIVDKGHEVIDKYTASGKYVGQITETASGPFENIDGIAIDTTGQVWVYSTGALNARPAVAESYNHQEHNELEPLRSHELLVSENFPEPGFAVDSSDDFYAHLTRFTQGSSVIGEFSSSGVLLREAVDREPPSGVAVELSSDGVYVDNVGSVGRFGREGALIERLVVPGGHGSGVGVDSSSETVDVPDAAAGVVDVYVREAPGKPTVAGESLSEVGSQSAGFSGEVNPRSEAGEPESEYEFQYGPCSSAGACAASAYPQSLPVPAGRLTADFEAHTVSVHPQDLLAHTTYHFSLLARNTHGQAVGEELVFTTHGAGGGATLADSRQWEMVSPPAKQGTLLEPIGENGVIQASARGDALTYFAATPTEAQPQGDTNFVQVLSTRTQGGWRTQDLTSPHEIATGKAIGVNGEFSFFSEDLSLAIAQPLGPLDHAISDEASEQTAFLRSDYVNGNPSEQCTPPLMHCYRPLVSGAPGHENVAPGTVFGEEGRCTPGLGHTQAPICGPVFMGASPDGSHVILTSHVPLTSEAGQVAGAGNLYEWAGGKLSFIGDGSVGLGGKSERHAVSNDGSRVIFEGQAQGLEGLLTHDLATGSTIALDAQEAGCGSCESGGGQFQSASSDGSRVFFTDKTRLTKDSGGGVTAETGVVVDLYEYDLNAPEGRRLKDLTPLGAGEEAAAVQGAVLGSSEDGSWVYFVADGRLAPGAVKGTCGSPVVPSAVAVCGLYVLHFNGVAWETPRLLAVLSGEDESDWNLNLNVHTSRVSPGGGWLAFMSQRSLTGYDNRDAVSGQPDEEVYLFDASRAVSAGVAGVADNPACASCNPTGARPSGVEYTHIEVKLVGGAGVWNPKTWIAANVPGWTPYELQAALYQSRYLSDSGRLFFNSSDRLVPQDVDGTEDVYEFEPAGVGSCAGVSSGFNERSGGCVSLVSSGVSSEESAFLDASETGSDVFFLTASKLAPADHDTSLDVYDAHECTSLSPCVASGGGEPPACITESSCRPSPTPQPGIFGAPSSSTFSGEGNVQPSAAGKPAVKAKVLSRAQKLAAALKACRKKAKAKRKGCEAQARKRYGAKSKAGKSRKAGKSTSHGGAK